MTTSSHYPTPTLGLSLFGAVREITFSYVGALNLIYSFSYLVPGASYLAILSTILCLTIEGEVILQNTDKAVEQFTANKSVEQILARKRLIQACKNPCFEDSWFVQQYKQNTAERDLMELCVLDYYLNKKSNLQSDIYDQLESICFSEKELFTEEVKVKKSWITAFHVINAIAITGDFISSIYIAKQFLLILGLTGTLCTLGSVLIAACAAISFGIIFYRTYLQIILDDLVLQSYTLIKQHFSQGSIFTKLSLVIASIFFVSLTVILILSSGGTFIKSGLYGQRALLDLSLYFTIIINNIFCMIFTLAFVIFNMKNVLESMLKLPSVIAKLFNLPIKLMLCEYFERIKLYFLDLASKFNNNSVIYSLLLFTGGISALYHTSLEFVFLFWTVATFIGHCVSVGVMYDSGDYLSPLLATISGTSLEVCTDMHYFLNLDAHNADNLDQVETQSHSNLAGKFLCIALFPLLMLDWVLLKAHSSCSWGETFNVVIRSKWGSIQPEKLQEKSLAKLNRLWLENKNEIELNSLKLVV